jgi:hypothetical protein
MAETGSVHDPGATPSEDPATAPAQPPAPARESVPEPAAQDVAGAAAEPAGATPAPPVRLAVVSAPQEGAARATGFLERAVLRRRLRFLRRRRELALHDLGGLVFETHRLGEERPELLGAKLAALDAIDAELETLERGLRLGEELIVLHEPGVSACARCGALHDSAARFCPSCGQRTGPGT